VGRTRGRRLLALAIAAVAVGSLLAACGDDDHSTSSAGGTGTDDSQPQDGDAGPNDGGAQVGDPPYEIETFQETFVDTSRATPEIAGTGVPAADERTLETTVRIPAVEGRFPLIVFSHGHAGHPDKFVRMLDTWAAAGYVVVAPAFPLSNDHVPGEPSVFDLQEQSGDVSFLIDEVLSRSHVPDDAFEGIVDNERVGIGGLSLGAATTYTTAFGECCADERVDAVVALSGLEVPVEGAGRDVPTFVGHSDDDALLPYESGVRMYESATGPAYLLTVFGGGHSLAYEDNGHPAGPVIDLATARFWDRYLRGDAEVPEQLVTAGELEGAAELQLGGDLPPASVP
jgi:dienelactone hydrolase